MGTKVSAVTKLERLIRAKNPVIKIDSYEESRTLAAIKRIAELQNKGLFEWSVSQGMIRKMGQPSSDPAPEETQDVIAAFRVMFSWDGPATIFVMKDAHAYMSSPTGGNGDPVCIRWLRDLVSAFQERPHTLILVNPTFALPPDLQKDVCGFDWPLPTSPELEKIVEECAARVNGKRSASGEVIRAELRNGIKEKLVKALSGLTEFEASNVLSLSVVATKALDERAIPFILDEKRAIIAKSGTLEFFDTDTTAADIGGMVNLKEYTRRKRASFSKEAEAYGLPTPKGYLMVGVPGAGKSLTAKASTGGVMPLLRLDVGALMGGLVGQSESNARAALKVAEAVAPCVLWIDEIEKGFSGMSGGGESDGGTSRRMLGTILTWMQEHTSPVYVVATANDVTTLPPELLRRFDDLWFVDLPNREERAEIVRIHLQKRGREASKFDIPSVVEATRDFTGAEIEKVVVTALTMGFDDGAREINSNDLIEASRDVVPVSRTSGEKIKSLREWAKGRARFASQPEAEDASGEGGRKLEL
jgi:ATP-dependent 26S proteasome regulatory subunit